MVLEAIQDDDFKFTSRVDIYSCFYHRLYIFPHGEYIIYVSKVIILLENIFDSCCVDIKFVVYFYKLSNQCKLISLYTVESILLYTFA